MTRERGNFSVILPDVVVNLVPKALRRDVVEDLRASALYLRHYGKKDGMLHTFEEGKEKIVPLDQLQIHGTSGNFIGTRASFSEGPIVPRHDLGGFVGYSDSLVISDVTVYEHYTTGERPLELGRIIYDVNTHLATASPFINLRQVRGVKSTESLRSDAYVANGELDWLRETDQYNLEGMPEKFIT